MPTIHEALAFAIQLHQGGRLQAAEEIYRQILAVRPNQADAWHLLGVIHVQTGNQQLAVEYISRALAEKPDWADAQANLGNAFQNQGKLDEAVACYRKALELKPEYAEAHNNLGGALQSQGKLNEAVACFRQAVELKPDLAAAHNNLGVALKDQGRLEEAISCWRRAVELNSAFAEAHNNLGNVLKGQGSLDEAAACCRRALELKPDYVEALINLGAVLRDQGKLDEAVVCWRRALELRPASAEAHSNLGNAWRDQGKLDEAIAACRRAVELKPEYAEAHNNLGVALKEQGELEVATVCYRRAVELKPDYAEARNNLGNALKDQGELEEAVACYCRALELNPEFVASLGSLVNTMQHLCYWTDLQALCQRLIDAADRGADGEKVLPLSPFIFLALPAVTSAEQQLRCARLWADHRLNAIGGPGRKVARKQAAATKSRLVPCSSTALSDETQITVGYLSADFHAHATAWLIAELLEKHDRGRFAVFGYSYGPDDGSPTRQRLVKAFDRFVDVREMSFAAAAEQIAVDEVDILVDLKGYTQHARTEILALRPAPIQVNYLGYPGTMGAEFIDYILVDDYIVPADQQAFFDEKLVHLPGCYQVNDSRREISPRRPSREECKLPADEFVFCSFNNSYKITPEMFEVWMRLLRAVPGSVLWLLEGNRFAPANLRREAEARGVASERLVIAPRQPLPEHLARHRLADLFLDTFPVNAHTTASDALWAGLPLLTLAGQTFASRVAGSLLRTLGLPELIATSLDDYEAAALRLARDRDCLADLRARLEANRTTCGLFDGGQFARKLEKAYSTMWEISVGEVAEDQDFPNQQDRS
jgi:protein O-GlcNAc transferase